MYKLTPMNPLPEAPILLQRWLEERAIDLSLRDGAPLDQESGFSECGFGCEPRIGEFRLLPGDGGLDRPCTVLLLPGDLHGFDGVPFSPYALPACSDEWWVHPKSPLRVLQIWNRRRLNPSLLRKSWRICQLDVVSMLLLANQRDGVSAAFPVGPSLQHPLDPRWAYRDECWAWMSRCLGEDTSCASDPLEASLLLAAEKRTPYGERDQASQDD